jgi:hypothetical protein
MTFFLRIFLRVKRVDSSKLTPRPGFEPGSKAPEASRMSTTLPGREYRGQLGYGTVTIRYTDFTASTTCNPYPLIRTDERFHINKISYNNKSLDTSCLIHLPSRTTFSVFSSLVDKIWIPVYFISGPHCQIYNRGRPIFFLCFYRLCRNYCTGILSM